MAPSHTTPKLAHVCAFCCCCCCCCCCHLQAEPGRSVPKQLASKGEKKKIARCACVWLRDRKSAEMQRRRWRYLDWAAAAAAAGVKEDQIAYRPIAWFYPRIFVSLSIFLHRELILPLMKTYCANVSEWCKWMNSHFDRIAANGCETTSTDNLIAAAAVEAGCDAFLSDLRLSSCNHAKMKREWES